MRRPARFASTVLAGGTIAGALLLPSVARPANPVLIGKTGFRDAYRITLTFANGRPVKTLRAGTYTLIVHDYSRIHNFALGSQTQNRRLLTTGIPWVGTRRYTLLLLPGSYAFACSAHFRTMNGRFTVTPASYYAARSSTRSRTRPAWGTYSTSSGPAWSVP